MPRGGPDGGDGGKGGDVLVGGEASLNTLLHLKYRSRWKARRGIHGSGKKRSGANGQDVTIRVPIGTVVWKITASGDKERLADITGPEEVVVAWGGTGGLGNARFVTSTHQEPVLAQQGEDGQEASLLLELKLLADVGLIGPPNAGKSTMLAQCSAANPRIAPYPFTTTEPVLGVVVKGYKSFVMMEIPGLIEGAHRGVGLGHEFLRHAERSRLFLHLIDGLSDDPVAGWHSINAELRNFSLSLSEKPQLIVVNKMDVPEVEQRMGPLKAQIESLGVPVFWISAATGEGVEGVLDKILEVLDRMPADLKPEPIRQSRPASLRRIEPVSVTLERGVYVVRAPWAERFLPLADLKDGRAMIQLWRQLERGGGGEVAGGEGRTARRYRASGKGGAGVVLT